MPYSYLAQPYTHPDPAVRQQRYETAMRVVAEQACAGLILYSPIVSWHVVAQQHALPTAFDFYQAINEAMLEHADCMMILRLPGWEHSPGLKSEIAFARQRNIPLVYLPPELDS